MRRLDTIKSKTISGLLWAFADLIANQGLQFGIQIFLAHLLIPKDFGIIGMITVFIAVSQSIVDSGFANALIREKEPSQEDYSTVFYFNLGMAISMYLILYFSANIISQFYKEPQLVQILRVLAIGVIINALSIIQKTIMTKNIDFKTQTKISLIASIISGSIAIILAYNGFGVWSLVVRTIAMQLIQSILFIYSNRWMPSLLFSMSSFKRLFGFGWKLLVSGLIDTLYNNLYYIIIGKSYSAIDLGYYTNAQKLRDTASASITSAVQKVSYPALSSIQDDRERLRAGYKKIIRGSVYLTFPLMIGLACIASPLITLLFGQKWIPSINYFRILCIAGMLFPLHAINLNIIQVKGRSDLFLRLEIFKKILSIILIGIVLFFKLGIIELLWISVVNSLVGYYINSSFSAKLLTYSTREQITDIIPITIISILMGTIVYGSGMILPDDNMIRLLGQIFIGIISYIGLSKMFKIEEYDTMCNMLISIVRNMKNKK